MIGWNSNLGDAMIKSGAASDDVADACSEVLQEVNAADYLTEYDPFVFDDVSALYRLCGCKYHFFVC